MALFENFPYTNLHNLNLDWVVETIKNLVHDEEEQKQLIAELNDRLSAAEEWINNYNPSFIQETVERYLKEILARMIFVEITDTGYIVYNIPDGWDTITFNTTGLDIFLDMQPEYGHLVLSY